MILSVDKLTKLFKPNEKFCSESTVSVFYSVHDDV